MRCFRGHSLLSLMTCEIVIPIFSLLAAAAIGFLLSPATVHRWSKWNWEMVVAVATALTSLVYLEVARRALGDSRETRLSTLKPAVVFSVEDITEVSRRSFENPYRLRVRNIGPGPALKVTVCLTPSSIQSVNRFWPDPSQLPNSIAAGEEISIEGMTSYLQFERDAEREKPGWIEIPLAFVRVDYQDVYGRSGSSEGRIADSWREGHSRIVVENLQISPPGPNK